MRRKDREITGIKDIESIISGSDVCRIAFASNNTPYIVTMNFGYSGGEKPCLYFHCAPSGKKMDMIKSNNYVCFEMDTDHQLSGGEKGCDWGMKYSSVVGFGRIYVVEDRDSRIKGLDILMSQYSERRDFSYDERIFKNTTILRLDIESITGKRK